MLRFLPIALAIHAPRNHLTQNKSDTSAQAAHVAKLAEIDELYTRWRELQC